jgi:hypothetical protein
MKTDDADAPTPRPASRQRVPGDPPLVTGSDLMAVAERDDPVAYSAMSFGVIRMT